MSTAPSPNVFTPPTYVAQATPVVSPAQQGNMATLFQSMLATMAHNFNMGTALTRADIAKRHGLDPALGAPLPGSNATSTTTNIKQGVGLGGLISTILGILAASGGTYWVTRPAPTAQAGAPAAVAPLNPGPAPPQTQGTYILRLAPPNK